MAERIVLDNSAANHVQAYLEYEQMVGGYDNGKMLTDKQYETFKSELSQKQANKFYVFWQNYKGTECKLMGPASKCFCGHRFKEHDYLKSENRKIHCMVKGCACQCFSYIPVFGSQDIKCLCKHSYSVHDPVSKRCQQGKCGGCHNGFQSTFSCQCGLKYNDHTTVIQSKEERIKSGKLKSIEGTFTSGGAGMLQKFGDIADYEDSYQKQIVDMGGQSGMNNRRAPLGYKQMHAIQPDNEQLQITGEQAQQRKSKLNDLNKRLNQERQVDQLDHLQNEQLQQQEMQQQLQQQQLEPYHYGQLKKPENVQGGVSALTLFNTPHQFTRVSVKPRMIKKY